MIGYPGPEDLWGKLRSKDLSEPAWHPLVDHCTDVACVLEALLAQPTIRCRLARAGGLDDLDRVQVARLCYLAFLHDLGKCHRGFQAKASPAPASTVGHLSALRPLLGTDLYCRFSSAVQLDVLQSWYGDGWLELLQVAFAHHGSPIRLDFVADTDRALVPGWGRAGSNDPMSRVVELAATGRALFADAFGAGASVSLTPAFQHMLAGLLMLADWLGSGDAEAMFPYARLGDAARHDFARARSVTVLSAVGLGASLQSSGNAWAVPTFDTQFGFPPRSAQAAMDRLALPPQGSVVLLESETGSGKTEAALRWATRLIAAQRVDGVFFAVPLRSAAVQLHKRMQRWLDQTFVALRQEALLAVPGYMQMGDAEGRILPEFRVQWSDGDRADRSLTRWAAEQPKRYAAARFAVGTIDQALLGVLQVKHAHLRAACLVRHLLVIDEVHASDPYMRALVERLIELFRACGGHVLLMSATLGAETRELLLGGRHTLPPIDDTVAIPYPLISTSHAGAVTIHADAHEKILDIAPAPWLDQPGAVAAQAVEAARLGAKVLVIRNTVRAAIETQRAVEALLATSEPASFRVAGVATLHHGRFAAEDRRRLDAAIEERLGKGSAARPVIVVATQTVEQSLDVDADLLLTDLCPIDVLLQRIGRLHRHRSRPGPGPAPCIVLGPEGGDLTPFLTSRRHGFGEGRAYVDLRAVEATRRLIGDGARWAIPADNRRLVEEGTHPARLAAIAEECGDRFDSLWLRHGTTAVVGTRIAHHNQAIANALDWGKGFENLMFPAIDEVKIRTRLGADDLLLPLDRPLASPFGEIITRMRLPGWMVAKPTWQIIQAAETPILAVDGGGVIGIGAQRFTYDRFGLRPETTS
ncbi:MAG: CRISPR-associated helicase Cas3' [Geminicoccaceae bacterium]